MMTILLQATCDCECKDFFITVQCGCGWLLFLTLVFLVGTLITSNILKGISAYIYEGWQPVDKNGKKQYDYRPAKTVKFSFAYNLEQFKKFVERLEVDGKSKALLQKLLKKDFLFMAFIFPFMGFLASWLAICSLAKDNDLYCPVTPYWMWVALTCWLFDILENSFALKALSKPTTLTIVLMRTFSILKWCAALIYLLVIVPMLILHIILWVQHSF